MEYSEDYLQTSGSLWLYYRDQPALDNSGNIVNFSFNDDTSTSFKYKKCNCRDRKCRHKKYWNTGANKISK